MNGDAQNTIHAIVILSYANKGKDRPARLLMRFLWWRRIIAFKLNFALKSMSLRDFSFLQEMIRGFVKITFRKGRLLKM